MSDVDAPEAAAAAEAQPEPDASSNEPSQDGATHTQHERSEGGGVDSDATAAEAVDNGKNAEEKKRKRVGE